SAYSLSTLHFLKFSENSFEVLKHLENSVEVLKIPENKLKLMKIPENKLESLKLQENRPDDPDIIHVDNSSDLALTTTLNDLEILALHINGQSIDVDAPPDIFDVDEDDDIIDDEDVLPYDLVDSDDEDLVNVDDDDGMSADVARGHGGDGGRDDRPPTHESAGGCRGKGTRNPNLGGRGAGRMHTRKETQNLGLRKITDELGPQPIRFEWKDNGMMLPLGEHSAHWANLLGEIAREFPMHFGSWRSIPSEPKARVLGKIRTQFDLQPHMQSKLWPYIRKGIDKHLGKIYTNNKSSLKRDYWIRFWSDPKNIARCAQNAQNRAKSTIICRQGSRTLAALRDMQMQSFATQEYPSLIQTILDTHTVVAYSCGTRIDEEMVRLQGLGTYTDDPIMAMVRRGKQRGHIPGVSKVLEGKGKEVQSQHESGSGSGCGAGEDDESGDDEDAGEDADS
nr:hypothetical protein [Tanacetum cinerariifolium]